MAVAMLTLCDLCGLPAHAPLGADMAGHSHVFCCAGCRQVYQILLESDQIGEGQDPTQTTLYRQCLEMGLIARPSDDLVGGVLAPPFGGEEGGASPPPTRIAGRLPPRRHPRSRLPDRRDVVLRLRLAHRTRPRRRQGGRAQPRLLCLRRRQGYLQACPRLARNTRGDDQEPGLYGRALRGRGWPGGQPSGPCPPGAVRPGRRRAHLRRQRRHVSTPLLRRLLPEAGPLRSGHPLAAPDRNGPLPARPGGRLADLRAGLGGGPARRGDHGDAHRPGRLGRLRLQRLGRRAGRRPRLLRHGRHAYRSGAGRQARGGGGAARRHGCHRPPVRPAAQESVSEDAGRPRGLGGPGEARGGRPRLGPARRAHPL